MANILIVEDERIVAKDLQNILTHEGYAVTALAASSDEAIHAASQACPDLVLMDIRIKGDRDGIETAEILRQRFGVPVVYLTAHADAETVARATATEPYGYVVKPFSSQDIRTAVEVALYKHAMDMRHVERERFLSTALDSMDDAVITCDRDERITFMNPSAAALTGWDPAAALGQPLGDVLQKIATTRRAIGHTAAPFGASDGGAVIVLHDVTQALATDATTEERMTGLATMAGGLVHEVNAPLSASIGNLRQALDDLRRVASELEPSVAERLVGAIAMIGEAKESTERVRRLVADLKTFSRTQAGLRRRVDPRACVDWALSIASSTLRSRARVRAELASVPPVMTSEVRLSQVVLNLLLNAAQAIAPGQPDSNEIRVALRTDDVGKVVIEVSDTGCGMPPEIVWRVFDPFFTTKQRGAGVGLGLSTSYGVVRSAGGHVTIESEPGVGSTFRITLPPAPAPVEAPLPPLNPTDLRRGRVLVIDDDAVSRETLRRLLEKDHEVELVGARAALARVIGPAPVDVILCDTALRGPSVTELYEQILRGSPERARQMMFVGSSGFSPETEDFLATVSNRHLDRPFRREELLWLIQEQLRQAG